MLGHQDEIGGFRSRTYAAFKDGYSLSPLILTSLRFVPPSPERDRAYARGVDFLATLLVDAEGEATLAHPRYPTYAIAGAVLVLNAPGNDRHQRVRDLLLDALRARQLTEERGWQPDDLSYGGWGYFAGTPDKPADPAAAADPMLQANLSATLFAIGALRLAGVPTADPALVKARRFVERCQNHSSSAGDGIDLDIDLDVELDIELDGGFSFAPAIPDGNKAGPLSGAPGRYRSYGSMTADGLRALIRLGLPVDHPRVEAASRWLRKRYTPARNPGDFPADRTVRQESAYYYYIWSSAHALRALGARRLALESGDDSGQIDWPVALVEELLRRQRPDGSWANGYTEMREDDPLLATAFAMAGLAIARTVLASGYRSHSHDAPR